MSNKSIFIEDWLGPDHRVGTASPVDTTKSISLDDWLGGKKAENIFDSKIPEGQKLKTKDLVQRITCMTSLGMYLLGAKALVAR